MDFLNKAKNILKKRPKGESFSDQIKREKEQKYLFRDESGDIFVPQRKQKKKIFSAKNQKKTGSQEKFSNFFQSQLHRMERDQDFRYIMGAIGGLLFVLCAYIIFLSPYFKISPNHILVEPLTQGVDIATVYRSLEGIYGKSIFTLDEKNIALKIKHDIKNTESIRIERLFPNGVKVLIKSLPIPFDTTITGVENKRFWVSSNGVLIPVSDLKDATFTRHLEIVDTSLRSEMFLWYKKVITDRNMYLVSKVFDVFQTEWNDLVIAKARYFVLENELHINLESNTKIILALQDENITAHTTDPSQLLLDELITLRTYIANNRNKLLEGSISYIDARIPGKLFVCSGDVCRQNLIDVYGPVYQ